MVFYQQTSQLLLKSLGSDLQQKLVFHSLQHVFYVKQKKNVIPNTVQCNVEPSSYGGSYKITVVSLFACQSVSPSVQHFYQEWYTSFCDFWRDGR